MSAFFNNLSQLGSANVLKSVKMCQAYGTFFLKMNHSLVLYHTVTWWRDQQRTPQVTARQRAQS